MSKESGWRLSDIHPAQRFPSQQAVGKLLFQYSRKKHVLPSLPFREATSVFAPGFLGLQCFSNSLHIICVGACVCTRPRARMHIYCARSLACSRAFSPSLSLTHTRTQRDTNGIQSPATRRRNCNPAHPGASLPGNRGAGGACPSAFQSGRRVGFVLFCAALLG